MSVKLLSKSLLAGLLANCASFPSCLTTQKNVSLVTGRRLRAYGLNLNGDEDDFDHTSSETADSKAVTCDICYSEIKNPDRFFGDLVRCTNDRCPAIYCSDCIWECIAQHVGKTIKTQEEMKKFKYSWIRKYEIDCPHCRHAGNFKGYLFMKFKQKLLSKHFNGALVRLALLCSGLGGGIYLFSEFFVAYRYVFLIFCIFRYLAPYINFDFDLAPVIIDHI